MCFCGLVFVVSLFGFSFGFVDLSMVWVLMFVWVLWHFGFGYFGVWAFVSCGFVGLSFVVLVILRFGVFIWVLLFSFSGSVFVLIVRGCFWCDVGLVFSCGLGDVFVLLFCRLFTWVDLCYLLFCFYACGVLGCWSGFTVAFGFLVCGFCVCVSSVCVGLMLVCVWIWWVWCCFVLFCLFRLFVLLCLFIWSDFALVIWCFPRVCVSLFCGLLLGLLLFVWLFCGSFCLVFLWCLAVLDLLGLCLVVCFGFCFVLFVLLAFASAVGVNGYVFACVLGICLVALLLNALIWFCVFVVLLLVGWWFLFVMIVCFIIFNVVWFG